ncbi:MAG: hypothetical protein A3H93_02755 [Rhodocyclales bacterium RIFCSPLOWO2_02_FULL_63_24]|nr:MAG: hypothetical protein A2040_06610 [Rhodocyclales bacterium GWA2_65_19]OHC69575.1 MAG: hypothetical protein A3H93_02755 [Rhodocyclales bacterium RIFCSPLOWO2_02_FULL_63_24]
MKAWFALCLLLALALPAQAQRNLAVEKSALAERRVALVIGNAAYPGAGALKNPANDARDMAAKLKRLGFDVIVRTDVRQKEMLRSLTEFGDKVQSGSEALFFYAGHGMQVRGKNYLIPIDAEIRSESAVSSEAVDVDQLLDKLAPARLSLVILDACRNNPFERRFRGGGQGLAQINAPTGTLIAYATAPGKVAADGDGRNGLYTAELLAAMDVPQIKIEDVFKRVRGNVVKKSGEAQTPWESSSLTGDFYFRPGAGGTLPSPQAAAAPVDTISVEIAFWESIKNSSEPEDFQAYLDKYPNGQFIALAERRVKKRPAPPAEAAARLAGDLTPGSTVKDCDDCPPLVVIPAGSFEMGSDAGQSWEKPMHRVNVPMFAMGRTEVTQAQWQAVMGGNPSHFASCGDCPVENLTWDDAQEFVRRLSQKTGKAYRLPSDAEWEYACRAGARHEYCGGDAVDSVAWYQGNSGQATHPVARKQGNAWGLYDMSGNVTEFTQDCWHDNYHGAPADGSAWTTGDCTMRVTRGGPWQFDAFNARALGRGKASPMARASIHGFRPARALAAAGTARGPLAGQYDGTWSGELETYGGLFESPVKVSVTVAVAAGRLSGEVFMYGETRKITGAVDAEGRLVGARLAGGIQSYTLSGSLWNAKGEGYMGWKLNLVLRRNP